MAARSGPTSSWDHWVPSVASQPVEERFQQISYRPTLVVGLGGTGCKVVQKLSRQVQAHFGPERAQAFQFLALDTDTQKVEGDDETLGPEIFVNLAQPHIRAADIIERMVDHPGLHADLQAWWPHGPAEADGAGERGRHRPKDIISGAHAVRAVGRFALWHQGRQVANLFTRRWGQAVELGSADYGGGVSLTLSGKVYVISSLVGGTGSGMYLDVAFMLRKLMNWPAMPVFFTGILLTDAAPFREYAESVPVVDRMNANIYAALTEYGFHASQHELRLHL